MGKRAGPGLSNLAVQPRNRNLNGDEQPELPIVTYSIVFSEV